MAGSPNAEPRTVKRKRSFSPPPSASSSTTARTPQTQLPHFHELNTKPQRHSHHPASRHKDAAEPYSRSIHSRSHSSAYSQHHSDSEREDHEHDTASHSHSPRQARSPYATSDLRGSPSTNAAAGNDPIASPRSHSLIAPRPSSSSFSSNAAASSTSSSRYLAQQHHRGLAQPATSHPGLNHPSSHTFSSSSRNNDHYRPRSPLPKTSSAKAVQSLTALESSHLSDLKSDLASITSPRQRGSSSSTPQTPATSTRKMEAPASSRRNDAGGESSSTEASMASIVKKEQSTISEKPRGGQACLECRLAKVRCLPSDDADNCQRCQRFNFECLFVQHKRGRKPKSKLQGRDLTLLAEAAYATNSSPVPQSDRPSARKSASASSIATPGSRPIASSLAGKGGSSNSAASPGVRWSSAPDSTFPAPPHSTDCAERDNARPGMDIDDDNASRAASPSSAFFSRKQPLSAFGSQADNRAALDPQNLFGVDVTRMTSAMSQAMRSLERRRGAPYTLVTNNEIANVDGNDDDESSEVGATPQPPGTTTAADTNAANESFELIAEQPLTLRVMLKPFEVSDQPDCETPRILQDDRNPLASQPTQPQLNDPITEGILTEPAARALFDLFMTHCNAWSGVFDPSLHTHDFVRKRSSFLYTVLLYVGTRHSKRPTAHHLIARELRNEQVSDSEWNIAYVDPINDRTQKAADDYANQMCRRIHDMAREHAARAFVDGDRTVLCCQAFFILASWKPLDDGLSVIQVGYAFRLAMDIQLHAEMPNCVKPNESTLDQAGRQRYEAVQRRFRNRQRTFMMLFVQDKSQQISNKITTHSISADNVLVRRCQTWWKHAGSIPTDAFVCASTDIRRIQGKYVELYDRIEALTSATSDGPSIMMPAFLSDLFEWSARWHEALGLREDMDGDSHSDDPAVYERRCQRLCLKLWKDNIKTYVSSLVLKSSLKQAALQEHQEIVRNHHRRSTTREKEDRDSISGKSHLSNGLEPGMVNLMAMPAFWPCVEGARGVLEAVCAFPPERLLCAPDATIMQTTHAAVLLCSLATVKSQPPLGPGYLRSNIQLIDQASAAFRRASITEEDTVLHIAIYLESLLRPKNAAPKHSAQTDPVKSSHAVSGGSGASRGAAASGETQRNSNPASVFGNGSMMGGLPSDNGQNGAASFNGGAMGGGLNNFTQLANFTLMSNNTDMFYSGNNNSNTNNSNLDAAAENARWFNNAGSQNNGPSVPQDDNNNNLFFNNSGAGDSFDREGLDAIASAAAAAAAGESGAAAGGGGGGPMDMSGVNWSSAMGGGAGGTPAVSAPWNNIMFASAGDGNPASGLGDGYQQQQQQQQQNNNMFGQHQNSSREQADETLRMLLRFLDG
ncbi:related to PRIB protein [Ustilago bromivora]|uniref:Related to PRIB protein n=1 Tax=Ustilago bromivora TaxID=307758 RepID=A0A1K0G9Z5_9BASI|nr:related to PRIB protein [Ustilago bromivora]